MGVETEDAYSQVAKQIIKEQETIIGPIALEQAKKVKGLEVGNLNKVAIKGNVKEVLSDLVAQYVKLFGQTSIEVCKEAVQAMKINIPLTELPEVLK